MAAQVLRDYQQRGLAQILDAYKGGARSVLAVAPTGSGKTTVFSHLAYELRAPVLILAHRRELVKQAANRLLEFGVDFGWIMPGKPRRPGARVQVASKDTLCRMPRAQWPRAGLVIADEAHLSTARTWQLILEHYTHAKILGFTATPYRLSGKPLAGAYDCVVVIARPRELREQGHLCDYVGFSYKAPDLSGVDVKGDDYDAGQSAAAMSAITGDIVAEWLAHARDLSTVVFACTVEHSKALTAEFRARGVTAEHLDGQTPTFQRDQILARVEAGTTQVLCNVGIAVEGLDIPRLKCCVDAAPTMSLSRAIQKWGRVRRPWRGVKARIHDHAFNLKHGLPDADRDYSLHAKKEKPPSLSVCESCRATYEGRTCPACGVEKESEPRGERELKTVEDAEQFGFSSADDAVLAAIDAAVPVADWKPPVTLAWDEIGRKVEGIYEGAKEEQTQHGTRVRHFVRGAKRRYSVPGTAQLNAKLRAARIDHCVSIVFTGEQPISGGRTLKTFDVEIDDEV